MIKQYRISLESKQAGLNASIAYPLYAWLLSQVPTEVGTALHEQATRPINQYILWNAAANRGEWVVNLMTDEMVEIFSHSPSLPCEAAHCLPPREAPWKFQISSIC